MYMHYSGDACSLHESEVKVLCVFRGIFATHTGRLGLLKNVLQDLTRQRNVLVFGCN